MARAEEQGLLRECPWEVHDAIISRPNSECQLLRRSQTISWTI
jgi:hypothetical protein